MLSHHAKNPPRRPAQAAILCAAGSNAHDGPTEQAQRLMLPAVEDISRLRRVLSAQRALEQHVLGRLALIRLASGIGYLHSGRTELRAAETSGSSYAVE